MHLFTDQTGRYISLPAIPRRIVSLVPSQTELLYDLGLEQEVAGITKFCIHPASWFHSKTRVGGTKKINTEIIHQLKPDLIIANKEENVKEQVEELAEHYPVWISDVKDLTSACNMILQTGIVTGRKKQAINLAEKIVERFRTLKRIKEPPKTVYLIWKEPYMTVGGDTFIHSMLTAAGFENLFSAKTRYPEVTIPQLQNCGCELLLLSSEPYPFKQKHIDELQQHLPHTKILLVNGEMFSWYGSRLLLAPAYFKTLLNSVT